MLYEDAEKREKERRVILNVRRNRKCYRLDLQRKRRRLRSDDLVCRGKESSSEEATSFALRGSDVVCARKMRRRLRSDDATSFAHGKASSFEGTSATSFHQRVSVFKPRPKLLHAFCAHTSLLITLSEDDDDHNNEEDDDHCSRSGGEGCAVSTAGRHYRRSQGDEGRRSAFSGNV